MIEIRAAQLDALSRRLEERYLDTLAVALAEGFAPAKVLSPAQLLSTLEGVMQQGRALGMRRQADLASFAALHFASLGAPELEEIWRPVVEDHKRALAAQRLASAYECVGASADPATQAALQNFAVLAQQRFSSRPLGDITLPCGAEQAYIEIQLIDMLERPVPGARYRIKLPDGVEVEGLLDDDGCAYFDHLDPGNCTVTFPDLDQRAVQRIPD